MADHSEAGKSQAEAGAPKPAQTPAAAREARLATALRTNLRRRKAAAKGGD
jgi:hypothetical protein